MTTHNRIVAFFLAILVILVISFSTLYISITYDHDCTGEDCQICCRIDACKKSLNTFGTAAVGYFFAFLVSCFVFFTFIHSPHFCIVKTLITLKVKLSD